MDEHLWICDWDTSGRVGAGIAVRDGGELECVVISDYVLRLVTLGV